MKTLAFIVLALALSYATPRAQGRGHAYGRYKHAERFEHVRPGPAGRVFTYSHPRYYVAPTPRVYSYRPRPSISFSFPSGYSTYQPYGTYYYPNRYIAPRRYPVIRERRKHEEGDRHFAKERRDQ